jgi:hypothetical protein
MVDSDEFKLNDARYSARRNRKANNNPREFLSSEGKFVPPVATGLVKIAPVVLGKGSGVRPLVSRVIGLLAFLAFILAFLHFGSLGRTIEPARSARPAWLLLAVLGGWERRYSGQTMVASRPRA